MNKLWKRLLCLTLALGCMPLPACGETRPDWYQAMLEASHLSLGSNRRLKDVVARAQAGERVTIAVIGGSVTEGAGAARPSECWAARTAEGFRQRWGAGDGSNVSLINAGVSGTPSTLGLLRWQRDVVDRVTDPDGLPDLVIIEYAVNDGGEPTRHQCYESLVRRILAQPNAPAVILLFSVFESGYTLQDELSPIGERYGLMMVSIRDGVFPLIGTRWSAKEFYSDGWHPTSLGHGIMADCLLSAMEAALAQDTAPADLSPDVSPVYGAGYEQLTVLWGDSADPAVSLNRGGFLHDDTRVFRAAGVGRVGGRNFSHASGDPAEPLTFSATFSRLLIAWRISDSPSYGKAEVLVDGRVLRTLGGGSGDWGQPETSLIYESPVSLTHTVEIRMAPGSEDKTFTVIGIGYVP